MSLDLQWVGAAGLLVIGMALGALAYDDSESIAAAIGYGLGVGLLSVSVTALGRVLQRRRTGRHGEPFWTPELLAIAGTIAFIAVIAIVAGDTTGQSS